MSTLSWSTRIKGFCICFAVGIVFSLMGALVLMLHLGMARFAIFYTLGNIVSMARYTQRFVYIFGYWLSGHNFSLDFFFVAAANKHHKEFFPFRKYDSIFFQRNWIINLEIVFGWINLIMREVARLQKWKNSHEIGF